MAANSRMEAPCPRREVVVMTAQGWIFMIASWAIITGLCFYCFRLIFKSKTENIVYPLDVESQLEKEQDAADFEK